MNSPKALAHQLFYKCQLTKNDKFEYVLSDKKLSLNLTIQMAEIIRDNYSNVKVGHTYYSPEFDTNDKYYDEVIKELNKI